MFDKRCRSEVERSLRPVGSGIGRIGVSADQLTLAGLLLSLVVAVVIGSGYLGLAALLLFISCMLDILDGAVAKASGTASPRGAFYDSVADRISDSAVLGGFAWYLASVQGAHAALLPMAVLGASSLVSYERAKAESLGYSAHGGLMERAERMLALGACLVFSMIMVPVLWVMLVLTLVTAGHRFAMVWRQASSPPVVNRRESGAPRRWQAKRSNLRVGLADHDRRPRQRSAREPRRASAGRLTRSSPGAWRRVRTRP